MAREKKFARNVEAMVAAGAKSETVALEGVNKATNEKVTAETKSYSGDYASALAYCGGNDAEVWDLFFARVVDSMEQASDRIAFREACEGPDASIKAQAKIFQKAPFSESVAESFESALSAFHRKGKIPSGYTLTVDGVTYTGPTA